MQVSVSRSGGFAGVQEDLGRVDTADAGAAAAEVERRVREVGFFDLPAELPAPAGDADRFRYVLTVVDGDRRHTVSYVDGPDDAGGARSGLRALVEAVTGPG